MMITIKASITILDQEIPDLHICPVFWFSEPRCSLRMFRNNP
jgi:hypothetical protein